MDATLLPDDVVREILARVSTDVAALFRCAVTCKPWRALIADSSFLRRRCWPENARHPSSLLGFFDTQHDAPCFSPVSPGSLLGGAHCRSLTSIITDDGDYDVLYRAVPLATTRGGLLLVRLDRDWIHLAVCNVLTGTCDVIPPLKCRGSCWNSIILTREDCPSLNRQEGPTSYPVFFKVLAIVCKDNDGDYYLYTFLSTEASWSEPRKIFDEVWRRSKANLRILLGTSKVVVCRGVAHWLVTYTTDAITHYYTFDVNVKTCHVSLTELSIPESQLFMTDYSALMLNVTVDERLSLLHLHEICLRLYTWTQGDDGTWLCSRVIRLKPPKEVSDLSCERTWLGEKSGMLFVRDDKHRLVYKIDTETGAMEDVTTKMFEAGLGMMAVPMEIDWPAMFISRLCVHAYSQS